MKLFAFVLTLIVTFAAFGSNDADSVKVYFRAGQRQFDPSLGDNREKMARCMELLKAYPENDIDSIIVRAYTSPDGTSSTNELLARHRCDAISDYIISLSGINPALIHKMPQGIAWEGLRELVEATPDVPSREKVLDILDNVPVWVFDANGKVVDGRKSRLMSLEGGRPYNWMLSNLFPQLRNAVAIIVVTKDGTAIPSLSQDSQESQNSQISQGSVISEESGPLKESAVSEPEVFPALPEYPESSLISQDSQSSQESQIPQSSQISQESPSFSYYYTEDRFALKTNLLYYAALMPNLELEWRIDKKWSVAIEGDVAWYGGGVRKYRLAVITPEVRYRFRERGDAWKGMYVGLFAGPGWYDLENRGPGYEGEGVMAGVSFGYAWPIARRLSLEAGVGVGYIYTRYKEYRPLDGHYLYQLTKDINYFGPLRLRLALVWRFGHRRVRSQQQIHNR